MKKSHVFGFIYVLTLLVLTGQLQAQEQYPNRIIELVIPMGPGGTTDTLGRIYADQLGRDLKVSITAVNRAGGTGVQGTTYVTRAKKDGYTLLVGSSAWLTFIPIFRSDVSYVPLKDLSPLAHIANVPLVFAVRSDSPFKTLDELVDHARKNPGKIKNSVGGLLTDSHLNLEILCHNKKIKITSVPFKSGAESLAALLGGHVDMSSNTIATLGPQIIAGKLRALSISSRTRHPDLPNLPTTTELGYPYANLCACWGLFAPAGVPQAALNILVPAVEKAFKNPEVAQRVTRAGFTAEYKGPDEFQKFMEAEKTLIEKTAADTGLLKK